MSSPHGSVCRHPFCAGAHGTQWRPRAQAGRRPPPSRRSAVRPYLPDFRLHPPAIPQGALHILRQFSACARRRSAGARAVRHSPDFRLRPPAIPQGRARYVIRRISTCVRPPSRRGAVRPYLPDFRLRPPPARGDTRCVLRQISTCVRRHSVGRTARNPAGWIPAFPRATTPRTAWTVRGGIGALRLCTLHGIRAFAGICRSGVRSLRISRSGNQARIPAAVRSPRLPLGRRGGGSLSLCRLAQPPRYAARTRSSARTSAAAPDMVIMPVPST